MAINFENFDSNQNGPFTSGLLGFHAGSGDVIVNPYHTIPQNNKCQNNLFISDSQETITQFPVIQANNEMPSYPSMRGSIKFSTGSDDPSFTPRIDNLSITHHIVQQKHSGYNSTLPHHVGIRNWFVTNHVGSSSQGSHNIHGNTINGSKNQVRYANRVNKSPSGTQSKKRIRFRFFQWTYEEEKVMDRELKKYTSLPVLKISRKIAAVLPKKSIRDVGMRIQWLIKHQKLDNLWFLNEPSLEGDLRDFSFYMPDDPNDPDLIAIQEKFGVRAIKHSRG